MKGQMNEWRDGPLKGVGDLRIDRLTYRLTNKRIIMIIKMMMIITKINSKY